MRQLPESGIFKATPPRVDAKNDVTTRAAREIVNNEAAARIAKTERLRAARLAREAADAPHVAAAPGRASKKR